MKKIVTKEYIVEKLNEDPVKLIGRALVAILQFQTTEEQMIQTTKFQNGVGFSKPDANLGTRCANYYLQTGMLQQWQIDIWSRPDKTGFPKICKYHQQLNQISLYKLSKPCNSQKINNEFTT